VTNHSEQLDNARDHERDLHPAGVASGIVIDNRTNFQITTGLSTANIYYGTKGVSATTQSRIVQLNQEF